MRILTRVLPAALLALLLGVGLLAAGNWYVDGSSGLPPNGSAGNPYLHIMDALTDPAFASGDTIFVAPGTYVEDVEVIGTEAHLVGTQGATVTVIQGTGTTSAVLLDLSGSSTVTGFTVTGGVSCCGGGIEIIQSSATITRSIITGNSAVAIPGYAGVGGGIDVYNADDVVIRDNLIVGNNADFAGGGVHVEGSARARIGFNTIVGNTAGTGVGFGVGAGLRTLESHAPDIANNIVADNVNTFGVTDTAGMEIDDAGPFELEANLFFQNSPENLANDSVPLPLPDADENLAGDPRFQDLAVGNYRLWSGSPAVDSSSTLIASSAAIWTETRAPSTATGLAAPMTIAAATRRIDLSES